MKEVADGFEFINGRYLYANEGTIGIDSDLRISCGFDNRLEPFEKLSEDYVIGDAEYTPQEAVEIADYMLDLWTKFRQVNLNK